MVKQNLKSELELSINASEEVSFNIRQIRDAHDTNCKINSTHQAFDYMGVFTI